MWFTIPNGFVVIIFASDLYLINKIKRFLIPLNKSITTAAGETVSDPDDLPKIDFLEQCTR